MLAPTADLCLRPEPASLGSPWQRSARLRIALPVNDKSRFRRSRMCRCIGIFWLGRKLQHGRALAFAKMRDQHNLAVGKFQRIMMGAGVIHVHLPEPGNLMRQRLGPPEQKVEAGEMALDLVLEGDLGARKQADGYSRFVPRGKAAGGCIPELRGDQLVSDPGGPGRNAVQAVVAHGKELRFVQRPCNPQRC